MATLFFFEESNVTEPSFRGLEEIFPHWINIKGIVRDTSSSTLEKEASLLLPSYQKSSEIMNFREV